MYILNKFPYVSQLSLSELSLFHQYRTFHSHVQIVAFQFQHISNYSLVVDYRATWCTFHPQPQFFSLKKNSYIFSWKPHSDFFFYIFFILEIDFSRQRIKKFLIFSWEIELSCICSKKNFFLYSGNGTLLYFSCILGNGTFQPYLQIFPWKKFLIFFPKNTTLKNFLIFSKKKSFSYILGNWTF